MVLRDRVWFCSAASDPLIGYRGMHIQLCAADSTPAAAMAAAGLGQLPRSVSARFLRDSEVVYSTPGCTPRFPIVIEPATTGGGPELRSW